MEVIMLPEAGSTNSELARRADALPHGAVVLTHRQTAGRGQRGNSWEAEPGKNLTFSRLLRPEGVEAARQFEVSEAVALGVARVLARELPDDEVSVKWPNDIYVGDRKICGILIENVVSGRSLSRSIAGIGVNVNQLEFRSDAPNPVSLARLTGREYDLERLLFDIRDEILMLLSSGGCHDEFLGRLYRRTGLWPFRDCVRGVDMMASIVDVAPSGIITLRDSDGVDREYAFKEVAFLIPPVPSQKSPTAPAR